MNVENSYARPMAVRTLQHMGGSVDSNSNFMFRSNIGVPATNNGSHTGVQVEDSWYEGGRPDLFAAVPLIEGLPAFHVSIECKAFLGRLKTGADDTKGPGWHGHQRTWWREKAVPVHRLYYIYLWLYPELDPARIYQAKAYVYMVPPEAWLEYEDKLQGRQTAALLPDLEREHAYKSLTVDSAFAQYRLNYCPGIAGQDYYFEVPKNHHIMGRTYGWRTELADRR